MCMFKKNLVLSFIHSIFFFFAKAGRVIMAERVNGEPLTSVPEAFPGDGVNG